MNVRKYGHPAAYVPNNKADKRWQKKSVTDRHGLKTATICSQLEKGKKK